MLFNVILCRFKSNSNFETEYPLHRYTIDTIAQFSLFVFFPTFQLEFITTFSLQLYSVLPPFIQFCILNQLVPFPFNLVLLEKNIDLGKDRLVSLSFQQLLLDFFCTFPWSLLYYFPLRKESSIHVYYPNQQRYTYRCRRRGCCHIIRAQIVMIAGLQHFVVVC